MAGRGDDRRGGRPRRLAAAAALAGIGIAAALLATFAWRRVRTPAAADGIPLAARLSVAGALRAPEARGFARALAPRSFTFPADHGAHPEFRTEWWYYTGNLAARDGRRFGFQLTFFRFALAPPDPAAGAWAADGAGRTGGPPPPSQAETTGKPSTRTATTGESPARTSAWAARQVYFAHFAVTDVASRRFLAYERWERQALGLAGAKAAPFRVWVGDWSAAAAGPETGGTPPMRLAAAAGGEDGAGGAEADGEGARGGGGAALDLVLTSALPPVPQGDRGLSPKSAAPGNASYYYSLPRLAAAGSLRLGAETIAVTGLAWMDREWSTSSLAAGEVGWDWFALQLDDGWELMLYRLRRRAPPPQAPGGARRTSSAADAGGDIADPASRATLIAPDGRTEPVPLAGLRFEETGHWTSPASRARYPSGWRLTRSAAGLAGFDLTVQPLLANQELPLSLRYWEGAVAARGSHGGRPVTARGYVELTGYDEGRVGPLARTSTTGPGRRSAIRYGLPDPREGSARLPPPRDCDRDESRTKPPSDGWEGAASRTNVSQETWSGRAGSTSPRGERSRRCPLIESLPPGGR
jgi:predicted secreted hydrolase